MSSGANVIGVRPVTMGVATYVDQLGVAVLQLAVQWTASTLPLVLSLSVALSGAELPAASSWIRPSGCSGVPMNGGGIGPVTAAAATGSAVPQLPTLNTFTSVRSLLAKRPVVSVETTRKV